MSSRAPSSLVQLYRATLKSEDLAFNVYVCRPLAALFVYALKDTRVAPNQVTFGSLFIAGVAAACLIFASWPLGLWIGVAVYELSYVFDKVDGMLARARGVQSPTGHLLDFLMDEIKAFLILAAVAVGAHRSTGRVDWLLWGLAGLVCLASGIGMTTFQRRPEVVGVAQGAAGPARGGSPRSGAVRLAEAVGRFFIHYPSYIWLAAVFSDVRLYLYPYVAVNVLYCARSLLGLMLRFGGPAPSSTSS
ncbi:MAG TPA: CDP-alcohol phosphatidyltransferase family protein [Polyangiaceae bacterium]|nr:CDP-alcohol phosphatidyltransferase family protein [Polyangiaceae bacterium]